MAVRLQCSDIEADAFSLNELLTCSRWRSRHVLQCSALLCHHSLLAACRMGMQLPTALKVQLTPVTCASLLYACEALL